MVRSSSQLNADARGGAQPRTDAPNGSRVEVEVEVKGKENQKQKAKAHVFAVPDWIPSESWQGFCEMRKRSRKPFTDRAVQLIVRKLQELRDRGQDVAEVLDQSTRNGWQDVFPLKEASAGKASRHTGFAEVDYTKGLDGFVLAGGGQ